MFAASTESPAEAAAQKVFDLLAEIRALGEEFNHPTNAAPFLQAATFDTFLERMYTLFTDALQNPAFTEHFDDPDHTAVELSDSIIERLTSKATSNTRAACILGELYWRGWGVGEDRDQAKMHYETACEQDPYANFSLAYLHHQAAARIASREKYSEVKYNAALQSALFHAQKACDLGYTRAEPLLRSISEIMPFASTDARAGAGY